MNSLTQNLIVAAIALAAAAYLLRRGWQTMMAKKGGSCGGCGSCGSKAADKQPGAVQISTLPVSPLQIARLPVPQGFTSPDASRENAPRSSSR